MAGRDVSDLMRKDAGDLRFVVGQRQQAAGHVDVAPRQGEGIDDRRVQHGEGEIEIRQFGGLGQVIAKIGDVRGQFWIFVGAAELGQDLGMFPAAETHLVFRAETGGKDLLPGRRRRLTGAEPS